MSPLLNRQSPTSEQLTQWVHASGENDLVECKGPMAWDGANASASLTKDIAALGNSRDGGIIVIGKSQAGDGSFSYDGLSDEQAASFDTTKVAQWVNARFSPPVCLACHLAELDGKKYVVILVSEFDDVPSLCIKSFQDSKESRKHILREGTIYVRNQNAESKPISEVDELRAVIGLATRKKGDELIAHFQAMLKGRSLENLGPPRNPFEQEIEQLRADLKINQDKGGYWLTFRPTQYAGIRWSTPAELEHLISKHSVRIYDTFPASRKGTFPMPWGIANDRYGETWSLAKSGLFCLWKEFRENNETAHRTGYRGGHEAEKTVPPGEWVELNWAVGTMVEFFAFLSRLVDEFSPGETFQISFIVGPLIGRRLVALNPDTFMGYGAPEHCRAPMFVCDKIMDSEALRTGWECDCADVLKGLVDLFPNTNVAYESLLQAVERYKNRSA